MDIYRGKKVLLETGSLSPACVFVQNGKIMRLHEGFDIPNDVKDDRYMDIATQFCIFNKKHFKYIIWHTALFTFFMSEASKT